MAEENTPLRIALLSYRSNPHCGGQGVYVKHLSQALAGLGHPVTVISGPPLPDLNDRVRLVHLPSLDLYNPRDLFRTPSARELTDPVNLLEWIGVSTMGFPEPLTFGIRAWRYLAHLRHPFDIVHDNQSLSYGIQAISRRIPTLATIHHPITVDRDVAIRSARSLFERIRHRRWYGFVGMQKRVSRKLRRIITVSERTRLDIAKAFSVPEPRSTVIANGIDTDRFRPLPGMPREPGRLIVTNSADMPLKGLEYLIRAVDRVRRRHPIRLIVVGAPKENGTITRLIRELGVSEHIRFTGRITDEAFVRHYARAAMAVVPSVYEGFGLPAGEAMACGVPVIATTGGALPEVVGNAGELVPPADPEALAQAITRLLTDPDHAAALGKAGYERVHQRFTWKNAAQQTVDAYRKVRDDYRRSQTDNAETR